MARAISLDPCFKNRDLMAERPGDGGKFQTDKAAPDDRDPAFLLQFLAQPTGIFERSEVQRSVKAPDRGGTKIARAGC